MVQLIDSMTETVQYEATQTTVERFKRQLDQLMAEHDCREDWPISTRSVMSLCALAGYIVPDHERIKGYFKRGLLERPAKSGHFLIWSPKDVLHLFAILERSRLWTFYGPQRAKLTSSEVMAQKVGRRSQKAKRAVLRDHSLRELISYATSCEKLSERSAALEGIRWHLEHHNIDLDETHA